MKKILFLLILPLFAFSRFQITTYMPIEEFFIKKIAQNHVKVVTVTNFYTNKKIDFKYSELKKLSDSRAYYHFGLDIETQYIDELQNLNPNLKIYDLSKGIDKISSNGTTNHFIWTDPLLLRDVAKNIYESLLELDSYNRDHYKRNYEILLKTLDELFLEIRSNLYRSEIFNIFVFDEYWDYFALRFRLNLYKMPKSIVKASEISDLQKMTENKNIRAILINDDNSFMYARSLSGNANLPIKTHNIFDELFFYSLKELSKDLSK